MKPKSLTLTALLLVALTNISYGSPMNAETHVRFFKALHGLMPDIVGIEKKLNGMAFKQVRKQQGESGVAAEYANENETVFVQFDLQHYNGLATNLTYSVSIYETDADYAHSVMEAFDKWNSHTDPGRFDDDEGWITLGWAGEEESDLVLVTVGHNSTHHVTKSFGHQLLIEEE